MSTHKYCSSDLIRWSRIWSKEGVAVQEPMLIFPKGAADKMEKINITEFDVILFFFIFLSFLLATVYIK